MWWWTWEQRRLMKAWTSNGWSDQKSELKTGTTVREFAKRTNEITPNKLTTRSDKPTCDSESTQDWTLANEIISKSSSVRRKSTLARPVKYDVWFGTIWAYMKVPSDSSLPKKFAKFWQNWRRVRNLEWSWRQSKRSPKSARFLLFTLFGRVILGDTSVFVPTLGLGS